jgi:transcriptional regulator with XRE-family HTH domain
VTLIIHHHPTTVNVQVSYFENFIEGNETMTFAEKLRAARIKRGFSQTELATEIGTSLRTIQNYESGTRLPKSMDIYAKLAAALGVNEETLKDETTDFLFDAGRQYGSRGRRQAQDFIQDFRAMCAGGQMDEDDLDFIMEALQSTYWETKRYNRRFVNKRYQKDSDNS